MDGNERIYRTRLIRADITKFKGAEVIVNTANVMAKCGSGVDRALLNAAGKEEILNVRRKFKPSLLRADVFATDPYRLSENGVKKIYHTVSTFWINGKFKEEEIIHDCYWNCLKKARDEDFHSIAFPLIGSGAFGVPFDIAIKCAFNTCNDFLFENGGIDIFLIIYNKEAMRYCDIITGGNIIEHISDDEARLGIDKEYLVEEASSEEIIIPEHIADNLSGNRGLRNPRAYFLKKTIDDFESKKPYEQVKDMIIEYTNFAIKKQKLFKKKSEIWQCANLTKSTYSDVMNTMKKIMPKKATLLRLAIGLRLDIYGIEMLLERAGCSSEQSDMTEHIVKEYIRKHQYDYNMAKYSICDLESEIYEKLPDSYLLQT